MIFEHVRRYAIVAVASVFPFAGMAGTPVIYTDGTKPLFEIEVPDFWSLRTGGLRDLASPEQSDDFRDISRLFGITPDAHDGIWVGLISPFGVTTLPEARTYLRDIGPFLVQDASVDPPKARRINGLNASSISGTGRREGRNVSFTVLAIDLPGARVAIAAVVIEAGADLDPLSDVNAMLASIQAVR
ncbi:hypothetical protein ROBYS_09280 [Roseobacter sp. OBYS 0001]|nr:hypothetical protein ROBYS_09280 [Roseobacter sp. OBYS 0001]